MVFGHAHANGDPKSACCRTCPGTLQAQAPCVSSSAPVGQVQLFPAALSVAPLPAGQPQTGMKPDRLTTVLPGHAEQAPSMTIGVLAGHSQAVPVESGTLP
jgi:hypothetical protein